jgi:hypothetical protein
MWPVAPALALLTSACEISFTPDIQPLVIPTVPAQPFGAQTVHEGSPPDLDRPEAPEPALAEAFGPEDPEYWIRRIETEWANINVISCEGDDMADECVPWPAEELELLYETLSEHILMQFLDQGILMIRTDAEGFAGLTTNAHELTHAAVWFHPELLEWWADALEDAGESLEPGDWRVGYRYDWSVYEGLQDNPELYEQTVQGELLAMTVSALMYDPWWVRAE